MARMVPDGTVTQMEVRGAYTPFARVVCIARGLPAIDNGHHYRFLTNNRRVMVSIGWYQDGVQVLLQRRRSA